MEQLFLSGVQLRDFMHEIRQIIKEEVGLLEKPKESSNLSEGEDYLDVKQASEFTKKAEQTLYGLCSAKKIPYYKRYGKNYFKKRELLEWIESGKVEVKNEYFLSNGKSKYSTKIEANTQVKTENLGKKSL